MQFRPELTRVQWIEIYYALEDKTHSKVANDDPRWKDDLRGIMTVIGADGINMALPVDTRTIVPELLQALHNVESIVAKSQVTFAAPKMLDALKAALAYEEEAFDNDDQVNGADLLDFFAKWRDQASDAITKIEGL